MSLLLGVCGCDANPAAPGSAGVAHPTATTIVLMVADDLGSQDNSVVLTAQPTVQNLR
jgi:hypothetical protein